ncbi:MAG: fumarate hydratase C-terminal domain-containing protein [Candidatus Omnitrophica bacterium]|nr:fumarate hydratase C-terminal domain-containing protein [Candidatus Omnitrophota bacterium]
MENIRHIVTPLDEKNLKTLKAGEEVLLSGIIYTARDQAHLRISEIVKNKMRMPVELEGQMIYYCGPTPAGDKIIGSCGPTTSSRMDRFTPDILSLGVKGMIGKGRRSSGIIEEMRKNKAVYFLAPAGAGAYLADCVESCKIAAFEDLGPEAIYKITVKDFPLVVGIDVLGKDIYKKL